MIHATSPSNIFISSWKPFEDVLAAGRRKGTLYQPANGAPALKEPLPGTQTTHRLNRVLPESEDVKDAIAINSSQWSRSRRSLGVVRQRKVYFRRLHP
jgi:hypothetical protein